MAIRKAITEFFSIPADNPELVRAQMHAFSKQIPIFYGVLVINMLFVSATHFEYAPIWLTVVVPLIGIVIAVLRLTTWWRLRRSEYPVEQSIRRLRSTIWLAAGLGITFTAWSLALFDYGDVFEKAQVLFFMGVTMIACVFCLMHLRAAAFIVATIVIIPFVAVLGFSGSTVMYAIAANMLLVTAVMLFMVNSYYADFATMVSQRVDLERTNQTSLELNAINHRLANLDSLTGLPNRRQFFARVEAMGSNRTQDQPSFAIGLLDLDGFKAINDLYGHSYGDTLLIETARRMSDLANGNIFIARLGGDEFSFAIDGDKRTALGFANALCEVLRVPYELREIAVDVSASCGVVCYDAGFVSAKDMFECADYALYQAKSQRNGHAVLFSNEHRTFMRDSHNINQALRGPDLADELSLAYQPIVCAKTRNIVSFEALARWNSPVLGIVAPAKFIVAAEASTLINKLTLILLRRLLSDLSQWPRDVRASFNLSTRNLSSPDTMLQIIAALQCSRIDANRIDFEVTETSLMFDFDNALRSLTLLRNLGCGISLDDFGTGHSSLSYVHKLPLDKIKIDRSFTAAVTEEGKTQEIVSTIAALGIKLGLECVAEGVETAAQAALMAKCGCNLMQGYHYAEPMSAQEVSQLIAAGGSKASQPTKCENSKQA